MGKRKAEDKTPATEKMDIDGEDSDSDSDLEILDVDIEFNDPNPSIDFHGLKTLLRQLFDVDNQLFDLSALTDLILSQPELGTMVKFNDSEGDPYAFFTVLGLVEHREEEVVKQLTKYVLARSEGDSALNQLLKKLLAPNSKARVGLMLNERVINMTHQVIHPLYNMFLEDLQFAIEDKKAQPFTHYILISKTYTAVASKLDQEENPPTKKKKSKGGDAAETFYFHDEDEVLQKHAMGFMNFEYEKQGDEGASDSKRTFSEFGVRPSGHLILLEGAKLEGAVKAVGKYLGGGQ